ncbi:hypothetical protein [Schlesneria paludicola]|uniref:hypothetical protein n=1 Tax=Schlesneria paludicola TaxID=360056 RepID=UPI00058BA78C|nr:hypothetical protein [Schlesneria paludicola]
MLSKRYFACILAGLVVGCDAAQSSKDTAVPTHKATPRDEASNTDAGSRVLQEPTEKLIAGIKFEIPAGWEEKTLSSNMIAGEYALPGDAGPGRLTLSTAGGGTAANMERWKGQFQRGPADPEPTETPLTVAGKNATLIEVHGTYTDMFGGGGPKSSWQLLGVAIPIDQDHNYFVKLTGPSETLAARRDEFLKFVESARFE